MGHRVEQSQVCPSIWPQEAKFREMCKETAKPSRATWTPGPLREGPAPWLWRSEHFCLVSSVFCVAEPETKHFEPRESETVPWNAKPYLSRVPITLTKYLRPDTQLSSSTHRIACLSQSLHVRRTRTRTQSQVLGGDVYQGSYLAFIRYLLSGGQGTLLKHLIRFHSTSIRKVLLFTFLEWENWNEKLKVTFSRPLRSGLLRSGTVSGWTRSPSHLFPLWAAALVP